MSSLGFIVCWRSNDRIDKDDGAIFFFKSDTKAIHVGKIQNPDSPAQRAGRFGAFVRPTRSEWQFDERLEHGRQTKQHSLKGSTGREQIFGHFRMLVVSATLLTFLENSLISIDPVVQRQHGGALVGASQKFWVTSLNCPPIVTLARLDEVFDGKWSCFFFDRLICKLLTSTILIYSPGKTLFSYR